MNTWNYENIVTKYNYKTYVVILCKNCLIPHFFLQFLVFSNETCWFFYVARSTQAKSDTMVVAISSSFQWLLKKSFKLILNYINDTVSSSGGLSPKIRLNPKLCVFVVLNMVILLKDLFLNWSSSSKCLYSTSSMLPPRALDASLMEADVLMNPRSITCAFTCKSISFRHG